ncbi:hypothetical protein [Acidaminococcus sp.]|uniref:hypothetical protein n=1 Tax=Acidaminococcus sp. TaxID=1872103 RepID=UPI003D7D644A
MLEMEHARQLLTEFNMPEAACQLDALLETAAAKDSTFISFLDQLLSFQRKELSRPEIFKAGFPKAGIAGGLPIRPYIG